MAEEATEPKTEEPKAEEPKAEAPKAEGGEDDDNGVAPEEEAQASSDAHTLATCP